MNVTIDRVYIHLRMLRLVEEDPNITQRGMTRRLGISSTRSSVKAALARPGAARDRA